MASEWQSVQLGDIARFKAGSAFKPKYQGISSGELPFIKVSDLNLPGNEHAMRTANNWISRDLAKEIRAAIHPIGATVFAKIGIALTYNRRRLLLQESAIDNNLMSAAPDESVVRSRYLYFLLKSLDFNEVAHGSALPYLNVSDLKSIEVELPSLDHQDTVLEVLGTIEDRIDCLSETNATLEAIAQALFKSWFVDFDPVRAKAEGREPEGMDAATAALFPCELEDSELGPIPKGWRVGTLEDVSDLNASKWTARKHPEIVKYIDLSGVNRNRIETFTEFEFDAAPSRARNHLREGDTIVGTVRPGNRAYAYIHAPEENLTGSTGFAVLSPKEPYLSSFVYLAATSDEAIERFTNLADGAAYPAVRPGVVASTPCVLPSDSVLAAFAEISVPMLEGIAKNSTRAGVLAELRDTLLPRLISGKLRLPEAEREIEAATA